MPHLIVRIASGRTEAQKSELAAAVTQAVVAVAGVGEDAVSVGIEDVDRDHWVEAVYRPEILAKADTLYKKPGYDPL